MWPEIELANKENRHEIILSGSAVEDRIKKEGLDESVFSLTNLNYLCINSTSIISVPDSIANLKNLQFLSLHDNKISTLNTSIEKLDKLKTLDLSGNNLTEIPDIFGSLEQIVTINFSRNKITKFPPLRNNKKLTELNLSNNQLTEFPEVCNAELTNLSELKLSLNQIKSIPDEINCLPVLKLLDVGSNKITNAPGNLADCGKLKEIILKQNPIADRRLLKLIDQCRTKQILDYIRQHCPKTPKIIPVTAKKGVKTRETSESEEDKTAVEKKYKINVFPPKDNCHLVFTKETKKTNRNIFCCIVEGVKFDENTFKKFLQIQNKLHDNECKKRVLATIATHDFKKVGEGDIIFTMMPPDVLKLKPLNRSKEMTGRELFERLQAEAEKIRKEKKRKHYSGIHRFLYLLEGKPEYTCLLNSMGHVISFPPITNSEITKMELSTTDILLEVSGVQECIGAVKNVMEVLLGEMVLLFGADLNVRQINISTLQSTGPVVYPNKNDLTLNRCEHKELIQVVFHKE